MTDKHAQRTNGGHPKVSECMDDDEADNESEDEAPLAADGAFRPQRACPAARGKLKSNADTPEPMHHAPRGAMPMSPTGPAGAGTEITAPGFLTPTQHAQSQLLSHTLDFKSAMADILKHNPDVSPRGQ
ncbi:unnamed protein product [Prorocentrum cordatum]|uniref:Uncharacterized protein n=1 Tax=Prorocentrum cordatum TaxID=2364126 RepID=A0ABN9SKG6_9DINO|nr:unnamed protein product [Polarella glacialis]